LLRVERLEDRLTPSDLAVGLNSNEPTLLVNPTNSNNVVVANYNQGFQSLKISTDGGTSFPISRTATPAPGQTFFAGDDSLAFDSQGRLFWSYLNGAGISSIGVVVQQVNPLTGVLVGSPVQVAPIANTDKEWIAADSNPASPFHDNVYVIWHDFNLSGAPVKFSRSTNGGLNWSTPVVLSGASEGFTWPSEVQVGTNGDVWVAWHANTGGTNGGVRMRRSTDGGVTFGPELLPFPDGTGATTTNSTTGLVNKITGIHVWLQGSMQPRILPDPSRPGDIYVVSVNDPDTFTPTNDPSDIVISRSTNNGATWTRATISQGVYGDSEFMPAAGIDANGNIAVTWYDNRRHLTVPDTFFAGTTHYLLDLTSTTSTDGGLTWTVPARVNDSANTFDPELGAPDRFGNHTERIGEYNGLAVVNGVAYADWTGNRTTGQQTFFNKFTVTSPPPPPPPTTGTVSGLVWRDLNGNGVLDPGEPKLQNWTVFDDVNQNGTLDAGEPSATSDASGNYTLFNVPLGTQRIREVPTLGWSQTFPPGPFQSVTLTTTSPNVTGVNFGNQRIVTSLGTTDETDWGFDLAGAGWTTTGSGYLGNSLSHGNAFGLLPNGGFEFGNLSGWASAGDTALRNSSFGTGPTEGSFDAVAINDGVTAAALESFAGVASGSLTGLGNGTVTNGSGLQQVSVTAAAGSVLSFDWNFLTDESVGPTNSFNDFGFVSVTPTAGGGTLQTLASTQTPGFVTAPGATGFVSMTGFKSFSYTFPTPGTFTITVGAVNVQDTAFASAVLVDKFRLLSSTTGPAAGNWYVVPPDVGTYELFATWVADPSNATNATYRVYAGGAQVGAVTVNQQQQPNDILMNGVYWRSLGVFTTADGLFVVTLDNAANGNVNADAILAAAQPPQGAQDPGNVIDPVTFDDNGDDGADGIDGGGHGPGMATAFGTVWQPPAANTHNPTASGPATPAFDATQGTSNTLPAAIQAPVPAAAQVSRAGSPFSPVPALFDTSFTPPNLLTQPVNESVPDLAQAFAMGPALASGGPGLAVARLSQRDGGTIAAGQDRPADAASDPGPGRAPLFWGITLQPGTTQD
jgi:hypothetical protein